MMYPEIQKRYDHFFSYIHEVGNFLVSITKKDFSIQKKGTYDLVTEADIGSEQMVRDQIKQFFPNDGILGEEGGEVIGKNEFKWIIDPLDGTTNYSHRIPLYGVSIGLENTATKKIEMGMVLFPELHSFYYATRGGGAFKNGEKISVSSTMTMLDSLFSTGFPYDRSMRMDLLIEYYRNILIKSRGVRRTGAATLDFCWLAEGKLDGYWEAGLKPWDMAAASLILQESGGKITKFDGTEFSCYIPNIVATNTLLHEEVLKEFQQKPW